MADLRGKQLKDGFQNLVTIGATTNSDPTTGALTNGKNTAITQVTLGLGSTSAPSYSFSGDTNTGMFSSGSDTLNLATGGAKRLTISSGGNVAIGTSNISSAKLQVGTSSEEILRLERDTVSNNSFIDLTYAAGQSDDSDANHEYSKIRTKVVANQSTNESGQLHFQTINSGTIGTKMIITQEGKVGIGETDPDQTLHVKSGTANFVAKFESTDDKASILIEDDDTLNYLHSQGGFLSIGGQSALDASNLNINSASGNVGIGTTSPAKKLHVHSGATSDIVRFENDNGSFVLGQTSALTSLDLASSNAFRIRQGSSVPLTLSTSGNVGIGTDSPDNALTVSGGLKLFSSATTNSITTSVNTTSSYAQTITLDDFGLSFDNNSNLRGYRFSNNGSERMRINSSGNVLVGDTTGTVFDSTSETGINLNASGSIYLAYNSTDFPNFNRVGSDGELIRFRKDGTVVGSISSVSSGKIGLFGSGGTGAVIDSSGRVGIGTDSPSAPLQVSKTGTALSGTGNGYGFHIIPASSGEVFLDAITGSSGNTSASLRTYNNGTYNKVISNASGNTTTFETAGSERMRIDSSGNVLVGKTTAALATVGTSLFSDGTAYHTVDGNVTMRLNRLTDDGTIIDLRKDGTTVGSISSVSSGKIGFFGSGETGAVIDSSGNVGIGTTSPSSKLHIDGNIGFVGSGKSIIADLSSGGTTRTAEIEFYNSSDGSMRLSTNNSSTGGINFYTQGTEKLRISKNGNVGIGTTSPDEILHIAKSSGDTIMAVEANDGNAALYLTSAGTNKDNRIVIGNAKDLKFEAQASGSGQGQGQDPTATATTVMTLTNGGNLALGTNAPIEVSSTANWLTLDSDSGSSVSGGIVHAIDGTSKAVQYIFGSNVLYDAKSGIGHQFTVNNGSEVMRMDTASRMLVGKTSSGLGVEGVEFNTSSHFTNFTRERNSAGGTIAQFNRTGSADGSVITFYRSGSEVGSITVTSSATAFNTSSDYRLKENIKPLSSALDRISKIKPSTFNFIDTPDESVDGFIAHELAEVVSYAVSGEKDGINEDGNPIYQGVDHSKLVPLLVGAIQELKAEIEQLKNK
mgnify:FL=1